MVPASHLEEVDDRKYMLSAQSFKIEERQWQEECRIVIPEKKACEYRFNACKPY
jgi:hypothetical protein